MYYNAVGNKGRGIGLITSKLITKQKVNQKNQKKQEKPVNYLTWTGCSL